MFIVICQNTWNTKLLRSMACIFHSYLNATIKCLNWCIEMKMENQFKGIFGEINLTCISSVTLMCMELQLSTFNNVFDILQGMEEGCTYLEGKCVGMCSSHGPLPLACLRGDFKGKIYPMDNFRCFIQKRIHQFPFFFFNDSSIFHKIKIFYSKHHQNCHKTLEIEIYLQKYHQIVYGWKFKNL